jgi:acyl-coenzyme A synthetase/AMP-(fatty) acid ligase
MVILYTSGTTDAPKKVVYSWSQIEKMANYAIEFYGYDYRSRILNMYPSSSIAHYSLTAYPAKKADAYLHNFFWNPYNFENIIKSFSPTHIGCTPKQIDILSKTKAWNNISLDDINIIIGGEKVTQNIIDLLLIKKCNIYVTYGSTEVPPPFMTGINSEWLQINNRCNFVNGELLIDGHSTGDIFEIKDNLCRFIKRKSEQLYNVTWKNKL